MYQASQTTCRVGFAAEAEEKDLVAVGVSVHQVGVPDISQLARTERQPFDAGPFASNAAMVAWIARCPHSGVVITILIRVYCKAAVELGNFGVSLQNGSIPEKEADNSYRPGGRLRST